MYYIFQNGNDFGFKCSEIHLITESDVLVSDEIYQRFFREQSGHDNICGKSFRIKNIHGTTFEEIFSEYELEHVETSDEKIMKLNNRLNELDHMSAECYECSLLGLELPYDILNIREERKQIKSEIEDLQRG